MHQKGDEKQGRVAGGRPEREASRHSAVVWNQSDTGRRTKALLCTGSGSTRE